MSQIQQGLRRSKDASVYHWIQHEDWPQHLFTSNMKRIPTVVRLDSNTPTGGTKSDPYAGTAFMKIMEAHGSFLDGPENGISDEDQEICEKLLARDNDTPQDTLFVACTFGYVQNRLAARNETGVMTLIHQLLIPSAEIEILRGNVAFRALIDCFNEPWTGSVSFCNETHPEHPLPTPQPDYSVGFSRNAFTKIQLDKLKPFLGKGQTSGFKGTMAMLFPFFTSEAKSGKGNLQEADHHNIHSMTRALKGVVELFRISGREKELHRRILGFSISYNHRHATAFAHYPVFGADGEVTLHRYEVEEFSIAKRSLSERWGSYKFVMAIYNDWVPAHFDFLSSAVGDLPDNVDWEVRSPTPPASV
ncbi:hypothetical protein BJX70DRAFT_391959 [Aspergillus crustosus]